MMLGDLFLAVSGVVAALLFFAGAVQAFRSPRRSRRQRRRKPSSPGLTDLVGELATAVRRLEDSNERLRDVILRYQRSGIDPRPRRQLSTFRRPGEPKSVEALTSPPIPGSSAESPLPELAGSPPPVGDSAESASSVGAAETQAIDSGELPRASAALNSRSVMSLAVALCVFLVLAIFVFQSAGTLSVQPRPTPLSLGPAQQARALAARGDYEGAWKFYYQALQAAPEDVRLWYAAGVVLSRLGKREATEEAFRYVVRRGRPDSKEVRLARQWLVRAGILAEPVEFSIGSAPLDVMGDKAVVKGKVTWGAPKPDRPPLKAQIILESVSGPARGGRVATSVPLGELYRFEGLPAGSYHLIGGAAGHRLWDLTFTVEDGKEVVVNLGKDNSSNPMAVIYL